jgi:hypothetical protein
MLLCTQMKKKDESGTARFFKFTFNVLYRVKCA